MLFHLPTFHATLNPCPVGPAAFTPHPDGKFCGSCQRVVQDFSRSENPAADLAAARAASPDGRVCGSFRREQVAVPPVSNLSRRLRWFVIALVLVVGQGLTAHEAWAQVRRPVPRHYTTTKKPVKKQPAQVEIPDVTDGLVISGDAVPLPEKNLSTQTGDKVYTYVERMPQLPGGGGTQAIMAYIQKQAQWPKGTGMVDAEGRVFVSFVVSKDGLVRDVTIIKGIHPLLDAEAVRAVQTLPILVPGRQGGQSVAVGLTVPVTFSRK
jgi:protein TonB